MPGNEKPKPNKPNKIDNIAKKSITSPIPYMSQIHKKITHKRSKVTIEKTNPTTPKTFRFCVPFNFAPHLPQYCISPILVKLHIGQFTDDC